MSDMDINAIHIITETCGRIIHKHSELDPKFIQAFEQGKITQEVVETCKREVLATCGVDITAFLAEQVRLGQTFRQILDSIRSFNSSVCLKLHFGVERGLIGAPRNMRVWSQALPSKKCLLLVWFSWISSLPVMTLYSQSRNCVHDFWPRLYDKTALAAWATQGQTCVE